MKQILDVALSVGLLVFAVPVTAFFGLLTWLTSRGPALYWQTRVGRGGRPFQMPKIRSMRHNCEAKTGAVWSGPGDPRVTRLGRFLRGSHLDELPQLWSVLRGEMSLVGPRPERPEFVPDLAAVIPGYTDRLAVRPGITGLAQIHLPPDTDIDSVRLKLRYDLYYIRYWSLSLDVRLIMCTALRVVKVPHTLLRAALFIPSPEEIERAIPPLPLPEPEEAAAPSAPPETTSREERPSPERNGTAAHGDAAQKNGALAHETADDLPTNGALAHETADDLPAHFPESPGVNGTARESVHGHAKEAGGKPRREVVH